ncbi:LysM peptidoglycan-binding domain-containing protein [Roseateles sp. DAIF2]|uniref:LysM peptidoglycan-binding domain-containing protein n=1 Tax=Roseateles sp. DAIF2 TaxID=2714952 RepID=UPI0018A24EF2|nr:LysM peptidoglycan-binding domain-containing protein [Roseateles sp. DAIF2]QPF74691.1 LysM peptidoglycan-binding domain-containing protein [Roseateles sp. DAIF2]
MVAIVSGNGLGVSLSSLGVLGGRGAIGNANVGRYGDQVYVNAATGNLILQGRDELLMGRGLDAAALRTYNSRGTLNDDNADNWSTGIYRQQLKLVGTWGAAGSSVVRIGRDGAEASYAWDAAAAAYVSTAGAGAYDRVQRDGSQYLWTDGATGDVERYDSATGRLVSHTDAQGNVVTLNYNAQGNLSSMVSANGETLHYDYDSTGKQLTQLRVVTADGKTLTGTRYGYDAQGRLSSVTVDLSPEDGSVVDGRVFRTDYVYGSDNRVSGLTRSDGTSLAFSYDSGGRITSVRNGLQRETSFRYEANLTKVIDPLGYETKYQYDAVGQLTGVTTPAVGGVAASTKYEYTANGDLARVIDAEGRAIEYAYDARGNQIRQRDALGNTVERSYDAANRLLSETVYLVSDPDGAGVALPQTTRYVYDTAGKGLLRFEISASGQVVEHRYNAFGERTSTHEYLSRNADAAGVVVDPAQLTEAALNAWVGRQDKSRGTRVDMSYDARGQLQRQVRYTALDASGAGVINGQEQVTQQVYDARGQLLQTLGGAQGNTSYTYDGLGRVLTSTDGLNQTALYSYDDKGGTVRLTAANGLTTVNGYDAAGRLVSVTQSSVAGSLGTTRNFYDDNDRLYMSEDATGARSWFMYDEAGRKVAEVDANGSLSEYRYNRAGQLTQKLGYATPLSEAVRARLSVHFLGAGVAHALADAETVLTPVQIGKASRILWASSGVDHIVLTSSVPSAFVEGFKPGQDRVYIRPLLTAMGYNGTLPFEDGYAAAKYSAKLNSVSVEFYADGRAGSGAAASFKVNLAGLKLEDINLARDFSLEAPPEKPTLEGIRPAATGADQVAWTLYDAAGRVSKTVDALGYVSETRYDGASRVVATQRYANPIDLAAFKADPVTAKAVPVADAARDRVTRNFYDAEGRLVGMLDAEGFLTENIYDAAGRLVKQQRHESSVDAALRASGSLDAIRPKTSLRLFYQAGNNSSAGRHLGAFKAGDVVTATVRFKAAADTSGMVFLGDTAGPHPYNNMAQSAPTLGNDGWQTVTLSVTLKDDEELWIYLYGDRDGANKKVGNYVDYTDIAVSSVQRGQVLTDDFSTGSYANWAVSSHAEINATASTQYLRNATGQVQAEVDAEGYLTEYIYDARGNLTQRIRYATALSAAQRTALTPQTALASIRPASTAGAQSTSWAYDALNRQSQQTDAQGTVTSFEYNAAGQLTRTTKALGTAEVRTLTARYDLQGRLTGELSAQGAALLTGGQTQAQIDAIWSQYGSLYTYDAAGRRTSQTVSDGAKTLRTLYFYSADGLLTHTINALGEVEERQYDGLNQLTRVVNYGGRLAAGTLAGLSGGLTGTAIQNAIQELLAQRSGANQPLAHAQTEYSYDARGQRKTTKDALGYTTSVDYNAFGEQSRVTQPYGALGASTVQQLSYDRRGLLLEQLDDALGLKARTGYRYDAFGRRITQIDGRGIGQSWEHDRLGRVVLTQDGHGIKRYSGYDAFARVLTQTDANGQVTRYAYDDAARSVRVTLPEGGTQLSVLNRHGELESKTDGNANLTRYGYDKNGKLTSSTNALTGSSSEYDSLGRLVKATDAAGVVTRYEYDELGRVRSRTADAGGLNLVTSYGYADTSTGTSVLTTEPGGLQTLQEFDTKGQLLRTVVDANGAKLTTGYTYDAAGRTLSVSAPNTAPTVYTYDALGRRTAEEFHPSGLKLRRSYEYDLNNNLVASTDANGNRTVYAYDGRNQLVYEVNPLGHTRFIEYDREGRERRVTRYAQPIALSGLRHFIPGSADIAALVQPKAGQDQVQATVHDRDGRVHYTIDANGSVVRLLYDGNGNVKERRAYATPVAYASWVPGTAPAAVADASRDRLETYTYDALNRRTAVQVELEGTQLTTRYDYDKQGNQVRVIDAMGNHTRHIYDAVGRLRYTLDAEYGLTERLYDKQGRLVQTIGYADRQGGINTAVDAKGLVSNSFAWVTVNATKDRVSSYVYDAAGRQTHAVDAEGGVTRYSHDANGNVLEKYEFATALTAATLQGLRTAAAAGTLTLASLGSLGTLAGQDRRTTYRYDAANRLRFVYDAEGYVTETRHEGPHTTTVRYATRSSGVDQVPATHADDRTSVQLRDKAGRLWRSIDALGVETLYSYDALGQLTGQVHAWGRPEESRTSYAYDAAGRQVSKTVADGTAAASTTRYGYNALGQLVRETEARGVQLSESDSAWAQGERVRLGYPTGVGSLGAAQKQELLDRFTTRHDYDQAGRRTVTVNAQKGITRTQYDAAGNAVKVTDPRGFEGYSYYDRLNRVSVQVDPEGYATRTSYALGSSSNRVTEVRRYFSKVTPVLGQAPTLVEHAKDAISRNGYDRLDRLLSATDAGGYTESTAYQWLGNRFDRVVTNKLGGEASYAHDRLGRQTSEHVTVAQGQTVLNAYSYNAFGDRIGSIEAAGMLEQRVTELRYDKAGRLTHRIGSAYGAFDTATQQTRSVRPVELTRYDALGRILETVARAQWDGAAVQGGQRTLNYHDAAGNKIASLAADGAYVEYAYDAAGHVVSETARAVLLGLPSAPGGTPPAAVADAANDRVTLLTYDEVGRPIRKARDGVVSWEAPFATDGRNLILHPSGPALRTLEQTEYDAAGNVVRLIDGRGNSVYTYYDKVGRKVLSIDQEGYATAWDYEGFQDVASTETRYGVALARYAAQSNGQAPAAERDPAALRLVLRDLPRTDPDRITSFELDLLGRVQEKRVRNVAYSHTGADGVVRTGVQDAVTGYSYNGLGNTTQIRERVQGSDASHTLNVTDIAYDRLGREVWRQEPGYADYQGAQVRPSTATVYNGLGQVDSTIRRASLTQWTAQDRATTNEYNSNGDLIATVDAEGNRTEYALDAQGRIARKRLVNVKNAQGQARSIDTLYEYDALGREVGQLDDQSRELRRTGYNAFGEVTRKGVGSVGWQEEIEYDRRGLVQRSSAGDGVTKIYLYDLNGNTTRQIKSAQFDLRSVPILASASDTGLAHSFSVYDRRNKLVRTVEPDISFMQSQATLGQAFSQQLAEMLGGITTVEQSEGRHGSLTPSYPGGFGNVTVGAGAGSSTLGQLRPEDVSISAQTAIPGSFPAKGSVERLGLNGFEPITGYSYFKELPGRTWPAVPQPLKLPDSYPLGTYRLVRDDGRIANVISRNSGSVNVIWNYPDYPNDGVLRLEYVVDGLGGGVINLGNLVTKAEGLTSDWGSNWRRYSAKFEPAASHLLIADRYADRLNAAVATLPDGTQVGLTRVPVGAGRWALDLSPLAAGQVVRIAVMDAEGRTIAGEQVTVMRAGASTYCASPTSIEGGGEFGANGGNRSEIRFYGAPGGAQYYIRELGSQGVFAAFSGGPSFNVGSLGLAAGRRYEVVASYGGQDRAGRFSIDGAGRVSTAAADEGSFTPMARASMGAARGQVLRFDLGGSMAGSRVRMLLRGVELNLDANAYGQVSIALDDARLGVSAFSNTAADFEYWARTTGDALIGHGSGHLQLGLQPAVVRVDAQTYQRPTARLDLPAGMVLAQGLTITNASAGNAVSTLVKGAWNCSVTGGQAVLDLSEWQVRAQATGAAQQLRASAQESINGVLTTYECQIRVEPNGSVVVSGAVSRSRNTTVQLNVAGSLSVFRIGSTEAEARNAGTANLAGAVAGGSGNYAWDAKNLVASGSGVRNYVYFYETRDGSGGVVAKGVGTLTIHADGTLSVAAGNADIRPLTVRITPDVPGSSSIKLELNGVVSGPHPLSNGGFDYTFPANTPLPGSWTCKFTSYEGAGGTGKIISKGSMPISIDVNGNITVGAPVRDQAPTLLQLKGPLNRNIARMQLVFKPVGGGAALPPLTINGVWQPGLKYTLFEHSWDPATNPPPPSGNYDYEMRLLNADGSPYRNELNESLDIKGVAAINQPASTVTVTKGPVGRRDVTKLEVELTDRVPDPSRPNQAPTRITATGVWSDAQNCMLFSWDSKSLPVGNYKYSLKFFTSDGQAYVRPADAIVETGGELRRSNDATQVVQFKQYVQTFRTEAQINRMQSYNAFGEVASEYDDRVLERMNKMLSYYKGLYPSDAAVQAAQALTSAATTRFTYNSLGQLIEKADAQTWETTQTGVRQRILPITRYGYDLLGRLNTSTDANGNTRRQHFVGGDEGLLAAQWNAENGLKQFKHDVFGNVRSQSNELGAITAFEYDRLDRLLRVDRQGIGRVQNFTGGADGAAVATTLSDVYTYDARGLRLSHTDALGQRSTTEYDSLGRVVSTVSAGGSTVSYRYDFREAGAADGVISLGARNLGGYLRTTTSADGSSLLDKIDVFGRTTWHQDKGGRKYSYDYNVAGSLMAQSSVDKNGAAQQNIRYDYFANGMIKAARDLKMRTLSSYGYDNAGNRVYEEYGGLAADDTNSQGLFQNATIRYDELNRMAQVKDNAVDVHYEYDAVGNRRAVMATYFDPLTQGLRRRDDLWYLYDKENRFTLTKGSFTNGQILRGSEGVAITYDAAGQRKTATYTETINGQTSDYTDTYNYSADGYLEDSLTVGANKSQRSRRRVDALGRTLHYIQSNSDGSNVIRNDRQVYDADNRLQSLVTLEGTTDYLYFNDATLSGIEAEQGATGRGPLARTKFTPVKPGDTVITTSYTYEYWDEAKQTSIVKTATNVNAPNWRPGESKLSYDVNGFLTRAEDVTGRRIMNYTSNATGLVLRRDESSPDGLFQHFYYYAAGRRVGDISTDPRDQVRISYAEQLARDAMTPQQQKEQFKNIKPVTSADFDQNYEPINASYPVATASSYTVRSGDTLSSIAQSLWGDAAMWYLIAEANGLRANDALVAGQVLVIPNKVTNIHNNANTYRPYNPGEVIGRIDPTLPEPPPPPAAPASSGGKKGCGGIGTLLMVVVAVVVTVYTAGALTAGVSGGFASTMSAGASALVGGGTAVAGSVAAAVGGAGSLSLGASMVVGAAASAAGSIASQMVGLATGSIDKFSWKSVGTAAFSGGITAGVGNGLGQLAEGGHLGKTLGTVLSRGSEAAAWQGAALRGAAASAVSQAMQGKWSWREVAAAGVASGAGAAAGGAVSRAFTGGYEVLGRVAGSALGAAAGGWASSQILGHSSEQTRARVGQAFINGLGQGIGYAIGESLAEPRYKTLSDVGGTPIQKLTQSDLRTMDVPELNLGPLPQVKLAPTAEELQADFRASERAYRQATDTGAVIQPGDTLERLTNGDKVLMGRYASGMGLRNMNDLRVGQSMVANWDMSASDALASANSFYAEDGRLKVLAAAPKEPVWSFREASMAQRKLDDQATAQGLSYLSGSGGYGEIRGMSPGEGFFTFNPAGRFMSGWGHAATEILKSPYTIGKEALFMVGDAVGNLTNAGMNWAFGGKQTYQNDSALVRSVETNGVLGTVGLVTKGAVLSLPGIAQVDALYRNDPYALGASGPVTALAGYSVLSKAGPATEIRLGLQSLDATTVSFTQSSVSFGKAGASYNLDTLVASMSRDGWVGKPIDVVAMPDGTLASIDNTRVLAARRAGIEVQANVRAFDEAIISPIRQASLTEAGIVPETWGDAALLRINKPIQNTTYPYMSPSWSKRFPYGSLYDPVVKH